MSLKQLCDMSANFYCFFFSLKIILPLRESKFFWIFYVSTLLLFAWLRTNGGTRGQYKVRKGKQSKDFSCLLVFKGYPCYIYIPEINFPLPSTHPNVNLYANCILQALNDFQDFKYENILDQLWYKLAQQLNGFCGRVDISRQLTFVSKDKDFVTRVTVERVYIDSIGSTRHITIRYENMIWSCEA